MSAADLLNAIAEMRSRLGMLESRVKHLEVGPPTDAAKVYEVHYDAAMNPKVHADPGSPSADAIPESVEVPHATAARGH